jgi:pimeloyl-ACP methyl ester carboxylesterase
VRRAVLGGGGILESGGEYEWYGKIPDALSDLGPDETIAERLFPGMGLDEELASVMNANDPLAVSAFATGMLDLAHDEAALRVNEIPVLLLIGEYDPYKYQALAALRVGSNMRMIVQAGRGHSTALRDPELVPTVRDFLRGAQGIDRPIG